MNRPSAKQEVAQAALRLAAENGVSTLTFESVAEAAGKTKGGVLYHFHTKEDLVQAMLEQLIDAWDADALRHLGKPFDEATREERIIAFMLSSTEPATDYGPTADLLVVADVARDERYTSIWRGLRDRWVGDIAELSVTQQIALVAADGVWVDEAIAQEPFPPERRGEILERLTEMIREG